MSILISCPCGKRLNVRDDLVGKRVKCPACGKISAVAIPVAEPEELEEEDDRPEDRADERDEDERDEDEGDERPEERRPRKRGKKKKRKKDSDGALAAVGNFFLANMKILITVVVLATIGGGLFWFLNPGPPYQVLEAHAVDAYVAFNGVRPPRKNLLQSGPFEKSSAELVVGGSGKIIVLRDNPQGSFVVCKLRIRHKFMDENGMVQHGTLTFPDSSAKLEGGGKSVGGLALVQEQPGKAVVDFFLAPSATSILPPDEAASEGIYAPGERSNKVKTFMRDNAVEAAEGRADYKGPTGLQVTNIYDDHLVTITWDPQSKGWLSEHSVLGTEDVFMNFEVTCIFPRPADAKALMVKIGNGPASVVRLK